MQRSAFKALIATLLLSVASMALSQTVRERVRLEEIKVYAVIFEITINEASQLQSFGVSKVTEPAAGTTDAVNVQVPDSFIEAAKRLVVAKRYKPNLKDGKPVEFFTYFFYTPSQPSVVITNMDLPLEKQP